MSLMLGGEGYTHEHKWKWRSFKEQADGEYIEVKNKIELLEQGNRVINEIGFCRLFVDVSEGIIWLSGLGSDPEKRCVYYLKS